MTANTGLDKIGVATGEHLNIALTTSSDPLSAIQEFQNVNGIDAETLKIGLAFLDLHGIKRFNLNLSIFDSIRDRLLQKINELSAQNDADSIQKLETLLDNSFPAVKNKEIRPIAMAVMKALPKVKEEYLQQLLEDKDLYAEASPEVKRQLWENNQALFGDEVQPLLAQYIKEKEQSLYKYDSPTMSFFKTTPKQRRQKEILTQLLEMIGTNVKLYDMVLHFLRTYFLRSRNTHYCTLRVELLMAIHDLELNAICSKDPCHKFTWCVDACIREKTVNVWRSRELEGFLNSVKKGQEHVLGDLSMVLSDPFAINTILQSLMKTLQTCVNADTLPRESTELLLLCRMLALGTGAWDMMDSGNFSEPKLEPAFFTKFLPYIVTLMAEDQIRFFTNKIPGDVVTPPSLPPDMYATWISRDPLACLVTMYYTLQCGRMKDRLAMTQILPTLIHCENDRAYGDTFLHCLSSYLIYMKDDFQHQDFVNAVLDEFFMPAMSRENVVKHLLRLLMNVHPKLARTRLDAIMEEIVSMKDLSESVRTVLDLLQDKISNYEPSPVRSPEKIDSPLMSVPAPTPAPHR